MVIDRIFAFVIGAPILIIIEFIRYIKAKSLKQKFINYRELVLIIFSIYLIGLISITLLPFHTFGNLKPRANILPIFNTIKDISLTSSNMPNYMIKFWIVNILGNLFILVPLATIVPILFKKFRNIKSTLVLCLLVSILIEFLQYLSVFLGNARSVDIDDVILNSLGALIGFSIFKSINKKYLMQI